MFDWSTRFGSFSTSRYLMPVCDFRYASTWTASKLPFHSMGMKSMPGLDGALLFGCEPQAYHQATPGDSAAKSCASARSYAMPRLLLLATAGGAGDGDCDGAGDGEGGGGAGGGVPPTAVGAGASPEPPHPASA